MKPQEKAVELGNKFYQDVMLTQAEAKQCALICVEEIIMYIHDIDVVCHMFNNINYWKDVYDEIEKL